MTNQLMYLTAQQKVADLARSAERARLTRTSRPRRWASLTGGVARLFERRLGSQKSRRGTSAELEHLWQCSEALRVSRSGATPMADVCDCRGGSRG